MLLNKERTKTSRSMIGFVKTYLKYKRWLSLLLLYLRLSVL